LGFGRDLLRDLRSLTEKVAEEKPAERDAKAERAIKHRLGHIKWNCQCHPQPSPHFSKRDFNKLRIIPRIDCPASFGRRAWRDRVSRGFRMRGSC
jgi:hypothetical protein